MRLETMKIKYLGEYPRDFPGFGAFEPGQVCQIDDAARARALLDIKLQDPETGEEVALFEEVPEPEEGPAVVVDISETPGGDKFHIAPGEFENEEEMTDGDTCASVDSPDGA